MSILKGGRGQKAPWETTHVRCPVPIRDEIQSQINQWKAKRIGGDSTYEEKPLADLDSVINLAEKVLNQKKSARVSIEKLLTEIYGQEVKL